MTSMTSVFNAQKVKDDCVRWIKKWFHENGPKQNCIIGISGGINSSAAAALCVEALGYKRVIGVTMPDGEQDDLQDSLDFIKHLGIFHINADISSGVDGIFESLVDRIILSVQAETNLPARVRMATLYAVAQSLNGRVANTNNLSETYIGYMTHHGDGAGDFAPLANLTSTEVKAIGKKLNLPKHIINKAPADGLCGRTDEERLGFKYAVLDEYIRTGVCDDADARKKINSLHRKNYFKLEPMPSFYYSPGGAPEDIRGLL